MVSWTPKWVGMAIRSPSNPPFLPNLHVYVRSNIPWVIGRTKQKTVKPNLFFPSFKWRTVTKQANGWTTLINYITSTCAKLSAEGSWTTRVSQRAALRLFYDSLQDLGTKGTYQTKNWEIVCPSNWLITQIKKTKKCWRSINFEQGQSVPNQKIYKAIR